MWSDIAKIFSSIGLESANNILIGLEQQLDDDNSGSTIFISCMLYESDDQLVEERASRCYYERC